MKWTPFAESELNTWYKVYIYVYIECCNVFKMPFFVCLFASVYLLLLLLLLFSLLSSIEIIKRWSRTHTYTHTQPSRRTYKQMNKQTKWVLAGCNWMIAVHHFTTSPISPCPSMRVYGRASCLHLDPNLNCNECQWDFLNCTDIIHNYPNSPSEGIGIKKRIDWMQSLSIAHCMFMCRHYTFISFVCVFLLFDLIFPALFCAVLCSILQFRSSSLVSRI